MAAEEAEPQSAATPGAARGASLRRALRVSRRAVTLALLVLLLALGGTLAWLDSAPGHRFAARQIASWAPQSGLRISVGRIEGSLYKNAVLHDVRVSDARGLFLEAPSVRLDWWPLGWLSNRLEIDTLHIPRARLYRLPKLRPGKPGKILPDFDIRIMRLAVDRLEMSRGVTGHADVLSFVGDADIRDGHALLDLRLASLTGRDSLVLALDSRPDENRFNVEIAVDAPARGLLATLAGLKQDANLRLEGKGDWAAWDGRLVATLNRQSAAGLDIHLRKGAFRVEGAISGGAIATRGLLARLSSPQMQLRADGRYADKLLSGTLSAQSDALALSLKGGVHLNGWGYDNLLVDVGLRKPSALLRNFDARALVARLRLNGPFDGARFDYLLKADQLRFGKTVLHGVRASGDGRVGAGGKPTFVPLDLSAQRIDGQGDIIASVLRRISVRGMLQKSGNVITSAPLKLRSDRLNGELVALFDLRSGRYDLALTGNVRGVEIRGLGLVDLQSRLRATPGPQGSFALSGKVAAAVRRLDNAFLRTLGGGLPRAQADVALGRDGRLFLNRLVLRAPLLELHGSGVRNPDGSVRLNGSGTHARYGPVRLTLSGRLERPAVEALLARPMSGAGGLADVRLTLDPDTAGYTYNAQGRSALGDFDSTGAIELPPGGQQSAIRVGSLRVSGSEGSGRLLIVPGGLSGRLLFAGPVHGAVDLAVTGGVQKVSASLRIDSARFDGAVPVDLYRGRLKAELSLDPGGANLDATLSGSGAQVGGFRINRFAMDAHMVDGLGKVRANILGQRGRQFNLRLEADVARDEIAMVLSGTLDGRAVSLDRRALLRRVEGGWALDPVTLRYDGGAAQIRNAHFGEETRLDLGLRRMPLSLLDLSNSDMGLAGLASGTLSYAQPRGGLPSGSARVTVRGLSRSGLTRTSPPVDLGINADLSTTRLALRAVIAQKGTTIGRGQALMTPLAGQGGLMERLRAAPVKAQLRYVGPAEAVWRMSRIEIVDITGNIALRADVSGTGANPVIVGALLTRDAGLESPVTGMRLSKLNARAQFDGSRLVFSQMDGVASNGGRVSGRGSFDFSLGQGVGIDMALNAENAELLNRDDIGATVSGPIAIKSNGVGGTISGEFDVVRSSFTLGRAAAVAQIPQLQVIERNGRQGDFTPVDRGAAWTLDIDARARNRLMVNGMGLASEWRMNLAIEGNVTNPRLLGRAEMIRGTYDFAGRRFDLTSGTLRFDGSVPANPELDITAEAVLSGLNATIHITGSSAAPIISFTSVPAMPQDEVLSRLLFGSGVTQLSAPEALQLAAAVTSLRGGKGGLDPINAVRKAAGLDRLRILPADQTTGQGTAIGAGKYITRRIYVELISDGQGYSATRLEYQVTRWLSLLSSVSTLGRQSITARISKDY
ncbi:translocation/assembly module TamB domain-containing protein [Sphingobium sp. DEHP117]|uniref:translocation/assembly module TamB domain-containing protein n=1 Tax=Sphingobium sp. DEHP117 TaxID=2993436 RepID=UPI0027D55B77|nr:translocation/assembly module TamB domain-containing protein [Sphingobium sp. DEHP117]MDQ4419374.1 translocation/assembly module TamB domain-containing protein [Sphingobium sp. DEHP117]